jgi:hypothetical protein
MALVATGLQTLTSGSPATSFTITSFTLPANQLGLIAVTTTRSGATPTGHTATGWTLVDTVTFNTLASPVSRLTVLRRLSATPITGTVVINCTETQQTCIASVVAWSGVDPGGTNGSAAAPFAAVTGRLNAVTNVPLTLPAYASATHRGYYAMGKDSTGVVTPDAGWTEIHDINASLSRIYTQVSTTADTSVAPTFPSADAGAIAIEIAEPVVSPPTVAQYPRCGTNTFFGSVAYV